MTEQGTEFEFLRDTMLRLVTDQKKSLAEAAKFLIGMGLNRDVVRDVAAYFEELRQDNYPAEEVIDDPATREAWYFGPQPEDRWWGFYKATLISSGKRWMIPGLDEKSTEITALLSDPRDVGTRRKGLVVGNVQSGKTANYTAVMAKAADAGYRFVIVLAGMHNNLRRQTQLRLENDLLRDEWFVLTNADEDFGSIPDGAALFSSNIRMAAVVKKNANRLRNLVRWFKSVPEDVRRQCPVLIIDDEADQATPNTLAEKNEVSSINKWLRQLWANTPTGTYVAYTATPFANVFINPEDERDLFPSDFITTLEVGQGYFGPAQVFGTAAINDDPEDLPDPGLDMVRSIPDADAAALKPPSKSDKRELFDPELPPSLKDAIHWFVVASAIRRARGQRDHSSMLVHTTHYAAPHERMKQRIQAYIDGVIRPAVDSDDLASLRHSWEQEAHRVSWPTVKPVSWEQVRASLPEVMREIEVKVDNGLSDDRLDYSSKGPDGHVRLRTVVAVGGGTLSRGLTLEGLVVSYFTRSSNTYDTLLQMGRWFGYRAGYEDLPRIWVGHDLDEDYAFLSRVEQDMRDEIRSFEGTDTTPAEVGLRIRAHPGRLEITARNKMYHASRVQVTLSGVLRQTFLLDGSDPGIVASNVAAVERLVAGGTLEPLVGGARSSAGHRRMCRDVSGLTVQRLLREYSFCTDQDDVVEKDLMINWIRKSAPEALWNVVVVGRSEPLSVDGIEAVPPFRIAGHDFHTLNRAPLRDASTKQRLNFKGIASPSDRLADIDPGFKGSISEMLRCRRLHGDGKGLILVYPISRYSVPAGPKNSRADGSGERDVRVPLAQFDVEHDLLGLGVLFPFASAPEAEGEFYSVRANWEIEETEDGELPRDIEASSRSARMASS